MSFSFLNNIAVAASGAKTTVERKAGVAKKERQPSIADIRVWKDGSIYPNQSLIEEFGLEYQVKTAENKGNAFDIMEAISMTKQIQGVTENFLLIGAVPRTEAKTDMFSTCTWDKEDKPVSSVADQGAYTYGEATLLPLLKSVYGVEPNEAGYIDLYISREHGFPSPDGIFLVPKQITRGDSKGQLTYVRRENVILYPFVPAALVETDGEAKSEAIEDVSTTTSVTDNLAPAIDGSVALEADASEKATPIDFSSSEYDHVVTQEDIDNNAPDLAEAGVRVGDTIGIQADPFA